MPLKTEIPKDCRKAKMLRRAFILVLLFPLKSALASTGATLPWITYEAEFMTISGGTILGPPPLAVDKNAEVTNSVASEASGRLCVKLTGTGQYVQFAAQSAANALVVRYSVPDTGGGGGADYTISLYLNGSFVQKIPVTSKYSWLYGYPTTWVNTPGNFPRNFYDEARLPGLSINPGDLVRLQVDAGDTASYYVIDLVDLENVAPLTQPPGSRSIITYGAVGNGITDDTAAINSCVGAGAGTVWVPPGNYLVSGDINVPAGTTVQGAGMWYSTFVGDPTKYANQYQRVRFNGGGNNIHLADFAITGKLNIRTDYEANDGLVGWYGTGSTIARIWVEHTKVGAWPYNSLGLVVEGCRFRNALADGINLNTGVRGAIVTNCTTRGTGDDCFAIWPAVASYPLTELYTPGLNVFTHCTAQAAWFANGGGIYGGVSNRIEDCAFIDMPNGSGVLINGTYPVGPNIISGQTVVQRCDLIRCGGYDPGWQWRGALSLDPEDMVLSDINVNNLNISNSLSYAVKFLSRNGKALSNSIMSGINITGYGLAVPPYQPPPQYVDGIYGVWAGNGANGSINVTGLTVNGTPITSVPASGTDLANQTAGAFTFIFLTQPISVTVQANPAGHSFSVDGTTYTNAQTFSWTQGASHTIATTSPQNSGAGVQDVWTSWSDGGAISHSVSPSANTTYTANFTTQYYLTMNAGAGGGVSPVSSWQNSNAVVNISATINSGFTFGGWTGSGSGSYSGINNPASITMNGPITETAAFNSLQVQSMSFVQQPGNVLQGATITPEVQVQAIGTNASPVAGAAIVLSLGSGTGTLAGTLTRVTDGSGIAHFNNLSVNQAGPKTLTATAGSGPAAPVNSSSFNVIGPVVALAFTTQPGAAVAGLPFGQQPVLKTVDAFGAPTTVGLPANLTVYVSLTNAVGTLSGTTSFNIGTSGGNGVMNFSNLAIDTAGTGNQLLASTLTGTTSNPVAGAALWLDAADLSTITTNGTKVQAWKNKVNAISFTQNTVGLQPWLTNSMGGKKVLTFSKNGSGYGPGCTYLGNIGLGAYTNSGNQMTAFVVARQSNDSFAWQGPVSFSTSGQTDGQGSAGVVILLDGSQGGYPFGLQRNHPATPMQATVARASLNTPFVLTFTDNAGAASLRLTEFSGVSRSNTANIVNGISPYKYNITDVTVGGRLEPSPGTIDNGWDGDVAEVLVYNTALSIADRASVETYLTNKWFGSGASLSVSNALSAPFTVQPATISVTVQANPAGHSFTVDGVPYTSPQVFNWLPGSMHTVATTSPQSIGTGQWVWTSWSDGGAMAHTVAPASNTAYTANFAFVVGITGMTVGGGGTVTISYATVSGLTYHVETTTNLSPAAWTTIPGSTTNAEGGVIIFIDPTAVGEPQRFYRIGSP